MVNCSLRGLYFQSHPAFFWGEAIGLTNNVFERCNLELGSYYWWGNSGEALGVYFHNNLFWRGTMTLACTDTYFTWEVKDNVFDNVTFLGVNISASDVSNNGFVNISDPFDDAGGILSSTFAYIDGPLGPWYQVSTDFTDQGSAYADALGLFHYTTRASQAEEATSPVDIGFHYPAVDSNLALLDSDDDLLGDWWEVKYFGDLTPGANGDISNDGTNNLQSYLLGMDPNRITFAFSVTNQYISTNVVSGVITLLGGAPSRIAVLVDSTNFAGAAWSNYTSSNITVNLGSTQGQHDVWVGLRGLPSDAQQTWQDTTIILDSVASSLNITNPANSASFNASRVNVCGNFSSASVSHIFVNGVTAFLNGTNFDALNVQLSPGTNTLTASLVDFTGNTNSASISITALTNLDGSLTDPVQLQVSPVAGFSQLPVGFQATNNAPGTLVNVYYDFNGDDLADFTTNAVGSLTNVYATNGVYFPEVTLQTTTGRFSSVGGWDLGSLQPAVVVPQVTVQPSITQVSTISITDPVDIKWTATSNLYVLSSSSATITEYNASGSSIRSLSSIGSSPSGLDVDAAGNVYVAMTGSNQVWKFNPTSTSFTTDTSFGHAGFIGRTNGATGTNSGEFNAPFDVAVSPDGSTISVSDSGNGRIQQFDTNGVFIISFGGVGTNIGEFSTPKGLTYDSDSTLFIVDSGNSRIVLAQGPFVVETTGTNGTALGQLSGPVNISAGERGVYVADAGNNRIQSFSPSASHNLFSIVPSAIRFALSTNLNQPASVAAGHNLTNELFYVGDTGNNRVVLFSLPAEDLIPVWTNMKSQAAAGNISGAVSCFSMASADDYRRAFLLLGTTNSISLINQIGTLKPVFINNYTAQYYFTNTVDGQNITFPVEFNKENGLWKITSF
jgi:hypothetical protein